MAENNEKNQKHVKTWTDASSQPCSQSCSQNTLHQVTAGHVENSSVAARDININTYNTFQSPPSTHQDVSPNGETEKAVQKLRDLQKRRQKDALWIPPDFNVSASDVITVHPQMLLKDFYKGDGAKSQTSYEPDSERYEKNDDTSVISFEDLPNLLGKHRFVALIGPPGTGKTTTSKRLVNDGTTGIELCFRLELGLLSVDKCTLRQLLLDDPYPHLDEKECELIFKWMHEHGKQCSIIMDGFDQLQWTLKDAKPTHARFDKLLPPKQLIANLFGKLFLPEVRIVLTSRPHAMIQIGTELRPNKTVLLQGLSDEDMKTLFKAFKPKNGEELMTHLRDKTPSLLDLCHNPLMLVFTVWAFLREDLNKASAITTKTQLFTKLLQKLRRSENARATDLQNIHKQLGELAWNATRNSTIEITRADLKAVKLAPEDVQDLIFAAVNGELNDQKLFEGDEKFYFVHQTWQEYFTALYLAKYIKDNSFKEAMKDIDEDYRKWSVVREFMCGLLLDPSMAEDLEGKKSSFFLENLKKWFKFDWSSA